MTRETKDACAHDQLPRTAISEHIEEGNMTQTMYTKYLKDNAIEDRKRDASKPIYLLRYE